MSKKANKRAAENARRRTARANQKFQKLSKAEQRVFIARDVLNQLADNKLVAEAGVWMDDDDLITPELVKRDPELQDVFQQRERCNVCALGALFVSAVGIADKLKLSELEDIKEYRKGKKDLSDVGLSFGDIKKYLKQFFSVQQLEWMETAFEQLDSLQTYRKYPYSKEAENFARMTSDHYTESTDRMKMIMQNVIANDGTFNPKVKPVPTWTIPGFVE